MSKNNPVKIELRRRWSAPENTSHRIIKNSTFKLASKDENDELRGCIGDLKLILNNSLNNGHLKKKSRFKLEDIEKYMEETPKFSLDSPKFGL